MGLDLVELFMDVEEKFRIDIPDEEAQLIRTPRQLCNCVARKLASEPPNQFPRQWTPDQIEVGVREVIAGRTGTKEFSLDDDFVTNLHLD